LIAEDAEVEPPAAVIAIDNMGQPAAIYRRDTPQPGDKYLGELCIARRHGANDWHAVAMTTQANWGFYPCGHVLKDGSIEAFHHVYGTQWMRSQEGSLTSKSIGQYGASSSRRI